MSMGGKVLKRIFNCLCNTSTVQLCFQVIKYITLELLSCTVSVNIYSTHSFLILEVRLSIRHSVSQPWSENVNAYTLF